jgi:anti-sigma factor RsiW
VTCREFAEFMVDYFSGELPPDARAIFERHLSVCENCGRYLTSYRESVTLGQRAFDDETATVPPSVPADLIEAILASRRPTRLR